MQSKTSIAISIEESDEFPVYIRVAHHQGKVYVDLCDRDRTIIEIDGNGWRKVENPPVRFYRTDKMLPLPKPQRDGTLNALKGFINIHPDDWPLFVAALLGCFLPQGTYPVISLVGGDGRCKTSAGIVILLLIDPNRVQSSHHPIGRDLILSATQHYLLLV